MPRQRQDSGLLHARHERSRKALRPYRNHPSRQIADRGDSPRTARAIWHARSRGNLCEGCRAMSLRNIGVVYRKELIDSRRDRRTVVSMIAVPLLVMPLLTVGMGVLSMTLVGQAMKEIPVV